MRSGTAVAHPQAHQERQDLSAPSTRRRRHRHHGRHRGASCYGPDADGGRVRRMLCRAVWEALYGRGPGTRFWRPAGQDRAWQHRLLDGPAQQRAPDARTARGVLGCTDHSPGSVLPGVVDREALYPVAPQASRPEQHPDARCQARVCRKRTPQMRPNSASPQGTTECQTYVGEDVGFRTRLARCRAHGTGMLYHGGVLR